MRFLRSIVMLIALNGCIDLSEADIMGDKEIQQSFSFRVQGRGGVRSPQVEYGEVNLITAHQKFFEGPPAGSKLGTSWVEYLTVPVPEAATIRWLSEDGKWHTVKTPIRSEIHDLTILVGFEFVFLDADVEVYLIERKNSKEPYRYADWARRRIFPHM